MKSTKLGLRQKLAAALGMLTLAGAASAVTVTMTPSAASVEVGDTFTVAIAATPDGATTNFQFRLNYDTALADATQSQGIADLPSSCPVAANASNINDALGRVSVNTASASGTAITFSGTYCTVTFTATAAGTLNLTPSNTFDDPNDNGTYGSATVTITTPPPTQGPLIVAGSPSFNSNTAIAGGVLGGSAVTRNITFGASTGASGGGTTDLACVPTGTGVSFTNLTQNDIGDGATPATIVGSFTPGAARTVTLNCTADRGIVAKGVADQSFSYTFDVAAGTAAQGPTINTGTPAPGGAPINVSGGFLGGPNSAATITFAASTAATGGTTVLACADDDANSSVAPASQNVTGTNTPTPVVVSFTPGDARTVTVTCTATGGAANQTFVYTYAVGAGSATPPPIQPAVVPASSLWSQLALIALFAALGGVFVSLRRNG